MNSELGKEWYIVLKDSLFSKNCAFWDTEDMLSHRIFVEMGLEPKKWMVFCKIGETYELVYVKFKKRDFEKFKVAMRELKNRMMLCGRPNYVEEVNGIMRELGLLEV